MAHGPLHLAVLCVAGLMWGGCQPAAPRNFGVVRPGILYRSGQPTPAGLEKVVAEYGIRTVVSLRPVRDTDGSPDTWEEELCGRLGVRHVRIAPDDNQGEAWLGRMAEGFLKVMDEPANAPVLVHCFAGRDRTGTMCAGFRMEYDGWTTEQALAEMREFGFEPEKDAAAQAYTRFVQSYQRRRP
jgi:tyrosine-protein phosphatase SIW14